VRLVRGALSCNIAQASQATGIEENQWPLKHYVKIGLNSQLRNLILDLPYTRQRVDTCYGGSKIF